MPNYSCNSCSKYDKLNGYFCRICGGSIQFDDKSRQKIAQVYSTDEKFCDCCGKAKHSGNCSLKLKRRY